MSHQERIDWHTANWNFLLAAIADVGSHLERYAERTGVQRVEADEISQGTATDSHRQTIEIMDPAPSIDNLCKMFTLSHFERNILLLCAGMELDARFPDLCAHGQGDAQTPYPTFGLALAALPGADWNALTPGATLRAWRLVDVSASRSLVGAPLRIDERILHYLAGLNPLDDRLAGLVQPLQSDSELLPSHEAAATKMFTVWSNPQPGSRPILLQVTGPDMAARQATAAHACALAGLQLYCLPAHAIPSAPAEHHGLMRLWERETRLAGRVLLVEMDGSIPLEPAQVGLAIQFAENLQAPVFISTREQRVIPRRPTLTFTLDRASDREALALWTSTLAEASIEVNKTSALSDGGKKTIRHRHASAPNLAAIAGQFSLSIPDLRAAVNAAFTALPPDGSGNGQLAGALWEAARQQARPRLGELAESIVTHAEWDDLVLPEAQKAILEQIVIHVRRRFVVYEDWGFAARMPRGLGVTALFSGPSGTGKTLAAEVLAQRLKLDLYRIDLSQVVSKYIGETEKNLRQVFDAAEVGGAILFFDEADALFGKRSEVKDSHDRYANIEISYLLQRMEAYRGLAILASNMKEAMDPAFVRRLRFVVRFPMPEPAERAEIWLRIFPRNTPTKGLDYEKLAKLNITGGSIRNIALHAAFLAAESEAPVQMQHILQATYGEYARLERPLTDGEIRGWV
jgi:SpoVK/Ycf46/Vps4 family AAA+-type ATPase